MVCPLMVMAQMPQQLQSSNIPPCHRHMVITTILSGHYFALLQRSANQTSAKCCLEFTTRGGYRLLPTLNSQYKTCWIAANPFVNSSILPQYAQEGAEHVQCTMSPVLLCPPCPWPCTLIPTLRQDMQQLKTTRLLLLRLGVSPMIEP